MIGGVARVVSGQCSVVSDQEVLMRDFRELDVWHKAHAFTLDLYRITASFPKDELYGLVSQLRRAAVSIEANTAEGCGKKSSLDFRRFLQIAFGSASEIDCELLIARDLGFISERDYGKLVRQIHEIKKMLAAFITSIEEKTKTFEPVHAPEV
ncbi:MAG: four helix bundle protein [Terriglobales bacterium]